MTVEFIKPAPENPPKKSFFGLRKPKFVEAPKPEIAQPTKNDTTNNLTLPSRKLHVRDRAENHLRMMVVKTQHSVEITDYEIASGKQLVKIGEPITLEKDAINAQDLVTTDGEMVVWRETIPGDPEF